MNLLTKLKKSNSNEEGFSLPELLVTVCIIGILAAIAVPIYTNHQRTAHQKQLETDVMSTAQSLAKWQGSQPEFAADPRDAQYGTAWNNKIMIRSNTNTTITLNSTGNNDEKQFCIQGTSTRVPGVTVSYPLNKNLLEMKACDAASYETFADENYG